MNPAAKIMKKYLFLGGPAHDKIRVVDKNHTHVLVPKTSEPVLFSPDKFSHEDRLQCINNLLTNNDVIKKHITKKKLDKYDAYIHASDYFDKHIKIQDYTNLLLESSSTKETYIAIDVRITGSYEVYFRETQPQRFARISGPQRVFLYQLEHELTNLTLAEKYTRTILKNTGFLL